MGTTENGKTVRCSIRHAPQEQRPNPGVCGANGIRINEIPGSVLAGTKRIEKQKMRLGEFIVERRMILTFAAPANRNSPSFAAQLLLVLEKILQPSMPELPFSTFLS
jgi:hypothetical protein